jgi:hypothetical protein
VVWEHQRVLRRTKVCADEVFNMRTYFVPLVEQNTVCGRRKA